MTKIVAITGGAAMGKSTLSACFQTAMQSFYDDHDMSDKTLPIYDADASIHHILKRQDIIDTLKIHFPNAIHHDQIDRNILGQIVFSDPAKLNILEGILHPITRQYRQEISDKNRDEPMILWDIPLLFETQSDQECDVIICVYCDDNEQLHRLQQRPYMNDDKIKALLKRQYSITQKLDNSDLIIHMIDNDSKNITKLCRYIMDHLIKPDINDGMTLQNIVDFATQNHILCQKGTRIR